MICQDEPTKKSKKSKKSNKRNKESKSSSGVSGVSGTNSKSPTHEDEDPETYDEPKSKKTSEDKLEEENAELSDQKPIFDNKADFLSFDDIGVVEKKHEPKVNEAFLKI